MRVRQDEVDRFCAEWDNRQDDGRVEFLDELTKRRDKIIKVCHFDPVYILFPLITFDPSSMLDYAPNGRKRRSWLALKQKKMTRKIV